MKKYHYQHPACFATHACDQDHVFNKVCSPLEYFFHSSFLQPELTGAYNSEHGPLYRPALSNTPHWELKHNGSA
jgi:hypothetical protein